MLHVINPNTRLSLVPNSCPRERKELDRTVPYPTHTPEEVVTRGEEIFEREIRPRVEPNRVGEFLVVDIESSDFEVDFDRLAATDRLLSRRPHAVIYGKKIGQRSAVRIGGAYGPAAR
ncbi:MAG: hypothetical protein ACKV0T_04855 [Planctomycetales bacterium]